MSGYITSLQTKISISIYIPTSLYGVLLQQQRGRCAQMSSVLDALARRPFEDFLAFCGALFDTEQKHIVLNYLTPELRMDDTNVNETDARPAASEVGPTMPPVVPTFDWRKLIRENLVQLMLAIDPDNGLLRELLSRGVINEWIIDTFMVRFVWFQVLNLTTT